MSNKTSENNQSITKGIRFKRGLINDIEDHKDALIPFGAWVQMACEEQLKRGVVTVDNSCDSVTKNKTVKSGVSGRNKAKPRYTYTTPKGEFNTIKEATDANGVKRSWFDARCKLGIEGYSRELK